ncbi:unnamed protein product [Cyclocybe aegerita]|uniref:DUF6534 domain-containing protein n=1 Tax=Cyclocybe aegerita TaxID=1973307 RepID=A0A8S0WR53_CYCAE|nr:unnamed protein product [Cyclocybe aegerita]
MKGPAEIAHGPMFIGFIFNVLLYGIMITQVYLYFTTFKKDQTWMKIFVFVLFIADTVNTVFDSIYLYRSLIVHFGGDSHLATANWLFATDPAITGLIASLVQFFFAWRVLILTRSTPLATAVILGSLAGGAGAVAAAIEVGRTPQFVEFRRFKMSLSRRFWFGIYLRRRHKTGFQASDLMVDRIIRITVQTGFITSLVATLDLIFFLTDPTGTHLIFNFPLCKLYSNSLMSSLNSRAGWKFGSSKKNFSSVDTGTTLGVFSTSNLAQAPQLSHTSPPNSPFTLRNARHSADNLATPDSPRRSRGLSVSRPPATVAKNSHPEIFVHVESHQSRDNVLPPKSGPGCISAAPRFKNGPPPSKKPLSVCLSIDADVSDGTSEGQEYNYGSQELDNGGSVERTKEISDME